MKENRPDMLLLREMKWSLQKIGDKYGICRERVRQIIGNTGYIYTDPIIRTLRKEELIAVKKEFRLNAKQLAELYNVNKKLLIDFFGKFPRYRKYPNGYMRCCVCHEILPYKEFYRETGGKYFSACKKCNNKRTYAYQKKSGYAKKYNEQYKTNGVKHNHRLAYAAIQNALKRKTIEKGMCEMKDRHCHGRIEAHHYLGYEKEHQLDVQWLCHYHHRIVDKSGFQKKV